MSSLRDIRKRIKSVKSTRQITKAMKMVAAAKLRRAQENATNTRAYAQTLWKLVNAALLGVDAADAPHPLMVDRPPKRIDVIVVTSDRGLAAAYNVNVGRQVLKFIRANPDAKVEIVTIGKKGGEFLRARGFKVRKDWPGLYSRLSYAAAQEVAAEVTERFVNGETDAVYVAGTYFRSALVQEPAMLPLLPLKSGMGYRGDVEEEETKAAASMLFEPDRQALIEELLPRSVSVGIFRLLLEGIASEHGARMTAMENATKAAGDMIGTLTLAYNRGRQAAITKELMEIVSGAEALKG
ncbi:MAG: ATP synthase gamma chain [Myxococcaceae bacterium]